MACPLKFCVYLHPGTASAQTSPSQMLSVELGCFECGDRFICGFQANQPVEFLFQCNKNISFSKYLTLTFRIKESSDVLTSYHVRWIVYLLLATSVCTLHGKFTEPRLRLQPCQEMCDTHPFLLPNVVKGMPMNLFMQVFHCNKSYLV